MSTLSTCGRCGGTIAKRPTGWGHTGNQPGSGCIDGHIAEPDDSAVSGPSHDDVCDGCDDCQEEA